MRVVDVADPTAPRVASVCPPPVGDFCDRGLRFGPHNTHENRPDSYQGDTVVFVTYFNARLRVCDVTDRVGGGMYVVRPEPDLAARMEAQRR